MDYIDVSSQVCLHFDVFDTTMSIFVQSGWNDDPRVVQHHTANPPYTWLSVKQPTQTVAYESCFFILICIRNNALLVGNVDLSTQHLFHQWHELLASNHLIHMSGPSFEVRAGPAAATPHGVLSCRFIGGATELNGIPVGNRSINKLQRLLTLW
jgi:hypothetical protein